MTARKRLMVLLVVFICCNICASNVQAAWSSDPTVNNAISSAAGVQWNPAIISDGSGGTIITWSDKRSGSNYDIYAQRVNASGGILWAADGVAICTAAGDQSYPAIISDGSGGAIITWDDKRSGNYNDIYAQRINASGGLLWAADGVAISTSANDQISPTIISDGSGGAIITWYDYRSGSNYNIYAQRINASAGILWAADGVAICTAPNDKNSFSLISDGSGGAIITWQDGRSGSGSNSDIYAQRINADGGVLWTFNGVAICTSADHQNGPTIISDGSDGAIITWKEDRSGSGSDIYAQRINASGGILWTLNGVAICSAGKGQYAPIIISDGSGGAIITWEDFRSGSNFDIYAQRINTSGGILWAADGVAVCTAANAQRDPTIISDGSGGAIIAWSDKRTGDSNSDIYAQRINTSGGILWAADGVAISTAANAQTNPTLISDGSGGAIITWEDKRSGSNSDIYAQRVNANGTLTTLAACPATIDGGFLLHIPYLSYFNPISGFLSLWADFVYEPNPTLILFKLTTAGIMTNSSFSCAASTLSYDLKIHISDVLFSDGVTHLWLDLAYSPVFSTDGNFYWVVTNYGVVMN